MVHGQGTQVSQAIDGIQAAYDNDVTDEFIKPIVVTHDGRPVATMEEGDVVLCFNFRTDRGRQITEALTQRAFPEQDMRPLDLHYLTMTQYEESFQDIPILIRGERN